MFGPSSLLCIPLCSAAASLVSNSIQLSCCDKENCQKQSNSHSYHEHLFKFLCIHSTRVSDVTHQTSTQSPLTFRHVLHCTTKTGIPEQRRLLSSVRSQEVASCFTSASVAKQLASQVFVTCSKEIKLLGLIPRTGIPTGYDPTAASLRPTFRPVPMSNSSSSISLFTLRRPQLVSGL
jgi:hypothetical protein